MGSLKPARINPADIASIIDGFMDARRTQFGGWTMEAVGEPTPSEPAEPSAENGPPADPATRDDLADFRAVADELGLTPGQIAGRLQASRKWEQRAKQQRPAAPESAETEPPASADELREQVRTEMQAEHEAALAETAVRGHLAGKGVEPDAIETIVTTLTNGLRGVITDGRVDAEKVSAVMGLLATNTQTWPDMGRGNRGATAQASGMDAGREAYNARRGKTN